MQGNEALSVVSFLLVRLVFDNYLSLGFGFGPEVGFIKRYMEKGTKKPSLPFSIVLAASSLSAVAVFHLINSNMKPGALGVYGPVLMGREGDHFLGLSIIAELMASFFYYAGFLVLYRCTHTKNRTLLKLILNLAGVYLVQRFTFDSLSTGTIRAPLKCWAAAASSAFENGDINVFIYNFIVHSTGLVACCVMFGVVLDKEEKDVREIELEDKQVESKKDR